jgi:hypothetical protein
MDEVIAEQTDRRLKAKARSGWSNNPCKVKDVFDEEAQDFISQDLRLGAKRG